MGMLKCWVVFIVMLVLSEFGEVISVRVRRLVVVIVRLLVRCMVLNIVEGFYI